MLKWKGSCFFQLSIDNGQYPVKFIFHLVRKCHPFYNRGNSNFKKDCNLTWFPGVEILWRGTVSAYFRAIWSKLCRNCLSTKFPHQEIRWNYDIFRKTVVDFFTTIRSFFILSIKILKKEQVSLREKYPHSELFWSVFSSNAGKYGPE